MSAPTVVVYPKGVRTEVPADVCRCPILDVGDACPVHQQVLDVPRQVPVPMYLTPEECLVLLQALVKAVAPRHIPPDDATECSRIVMESRATSVQRSLATALAEATY